jgi:protein O-mannosyl-transferase
VGQNDSQRARSQTRQGRDGVAFFSSARPLAGGAADRRPLGAAALLSKVMVVGLPIVLVVLDVYPLRRVPASGARWPTQLVKLAILEKAPFLLLSSAVVAVPLVIAAPRALTTPLSVLGMVPRLAVSAYGLAFYLW